LAQADIENIAIDAGWPTLAADAAPALADGSTSLAEVLRVVTL